MTMDIGRSSILAHEHIFCQASLFLVELYLFLKLI